MAATEARAAQRGGRGARERILASAGRLFYRHGIHATGIAALTADAHVSTRTFYQHFASKDALVEAYLRRYETDLPLPVTRVLSRGDRPAAERLLAIFGPAEPAEPAEGDVVRGCPFHNAAVEAAGDMPDVARLVERAKRAFRDQLTAVAAEAGAVDPGRLGSQLAVVYEGATALATSCNDGTAFTDARDAASVLIQAACAAG
jgi:AcrR family transcriptional regulator